MVIGGPDSNVFRACFVNSATRFLDMQEQFHQLKTEKPGDATDFDFYSYMYTKLVDFAALGFGAQPLKIF